MARFRVEELVTRLYAAQETLADADAVFRRAAERAGFSHTSVDALKVTISRILANPTDKAFASDPDPNIKWLSQAVSSVMHRRNALIRLLRTYVDLVENAPLFENIGELDAVLQAIATPPKSVAVCKPTSFAPSPIVWADPANSLDGQEDSTQYTSDATPQSQRASPSPSRLVSTTIQRSRRQTAPPGAHAAADPARQTAPGSRTPKGPSLPPETLKKHAAIALTLYSQPHAQYPGDQPAEHRAGLSYRESTQQDGFMEGTSVATTPSAKHQSGGMPVSTGCRITSGARPGAAGGGKPGPYVEDSHVFKECTSTLQRTPPGSLRPRLGVDPASVPGRNVGRGLVPFTSTSSTSAIDARALQVLRAVCAPMILEAQLDQPLRLCHSCVQAWRRGAMVCLHGQHSAHG